LAVQAHTSASWKLFARPAAQHKINSETESIVERLKLGSLAQKAARDLSYGDQRKVELAIALAGRPKCRIVRKQRRNPRGLVSHLKWLVFCSFAVLC